MGLQNKEEEKKKENSYINMNSIDFFEGFFFYVSLERLYVIVYVVTEKISFSCIF